MPRTGTGPFPAGRSQARGSAFPVPGGHYGFATRDTQFSTAPYGGSYGPAAGGQSGVAVPGGYYGPVVAPSQAGRGQGDADQGYSDQDYSDQDDPVQDGPVQDGPGRPAQWPLQSRLELGGLPGAVPCSRLHTRLVLTEWGQAGLGDSVELIVSELMTNALRACTDPVTGRPGYDHEGRLLPLGLRLACDRRQVLVEVWDGSMAPPLPGRISPDGETGRGLLMVEAVSSRWGYYYPGRQPRGTAPDNRASKVVWALIQPGAWNG